CLTAHDLICDEARVSVIDKIVKRFTSYGRLAGLVAHPPRLRSRQLGSRSLLLGTRTSSAAGSPEHEPAPFEGRARRTPCFYESAIPTQSQRPRQIEHLRRPRPRRHPRLDRDAADAVVLAHAATRDCRAARPVQPPAPRRGRGHRLPLLPHV